MRREASCASANRGQTEQPAFENVPRALAATAAHRNLDPPVRARCRPAVCCRRARPEREHSNDRTTLRLRRGRPGPELTQRVGAVKPFFSPACRRSTPGHAGTRPPPSAAALFAGILSALQAPVVTTKHWLASQLPRIHSALHRRWVPGRRAICLDTPYTRPDVVCIRLRFLWRS